MAYPISQKLPSMAGVHSQWEVRDGVEKAGWDQITDYLSQVFGFCFCLFEQGSNMKQSRRDNGKINKGIFQLSYKKQ